MMEVSQAKRLRELEKENARLKKIVADQVLNRVKLRTEPLRHKG